MPKISLKREVYNMPDFEDTFDEDEWDEEEDLKEMF